MATQFQLEQKEFLEDLIKNLRVAILKVSSRVQSSFSIDTGQSKETVTLANITQYKNMLDNAISQLDELDSEISGVGNSPCYMRPMF